LNDFASPFGLSNVPFDAVGFTAMRKHNVDLADLFAVAKEISRSFEFFLVIGFSEKQRVSERFNESGFAMTVSACNTIHASLKVDGHATAINTLSVRFDIL
jgi:hypothetical protein